MSSPIRCLPHVILVTTLLSLAPLSAADPPEEVAKLIMQLKDPNEAVRLKAAKELGKLKASAKPALEALAKVAASDPDEDVRAVAKKAVAAIKAAVEETDKEKDKEIVAPLLNGLKSKKAAERVAALDELTKLGEKARPATTAIVEAMMDSVPAVREAAAGCLEKVDPTIHKHTVSILYDADKFQKADAVAQLGKLGARAKSAVPLLKSYYASNSTARRPDTATLAALVSIVPDDPLIVNEVLLLVSASDRARADGLLLLDLIETTKKKKVEALIAALSDASYRVQVIERLAKFGADAKPALPALMKLKLDSTPEVREAATKAIETIKAE